MVYVVTGQLIQIGRSYKGICCNYFNMEEDYKLDTKLDHMIESEARRIERQREGHLDSKGDSRLPDFAGGLLGVVPATWFYQAGHGEYVIAIACLYPLYTGLNKIIGTQMPKKHKTFGTALTIGSSSVIAYDIFERVLGN